MRMCFVFNQVGGDRLFGQDFVRSLRDIIFLVSELIISLEETYFCRGLVNIFSYRLVPISECIFIELPE